MTNGIPLVFSLLCLLGAGAVGQEPTSAARAPAAWPLPVPDALRVAITKADRLVVTWAEKALADDHPHDPAWKRAPYAEIALIPQQIAMPALDKGTVDKLTVQALTDGTRIAFRMAWSDPTPDGNVDAGRFSDAVSLQLPLDAGATPTMGHAEAKVYLVYWKALWQKDQDVGFQDVQDLHPNAWSDLYWFAEHGGPARVPEAFQKPESRQWFIAQRAGNPMAVWSREQPVEELVAKGWGTTTHQEHSASRGRGSWVGGEWAVVISRPLRTDDSDDYQFEPGKGGEAAFAVWDGSAGQAGGRKHWTLQWTPFVFPAASRDAPAEAGR